jgi:hypothetical protein
LRAHGRKISSVHVPNFCDRSRRKVYPAYLNGYDLENAKIRVGGDPHWSKREIVDYTLCSIHGHSMNEVRCG